MPTPKTLFDHCGSAVMQEELEKKAENTGHTPFLTSAKFLEFDGLQETSGTGRMKATFLLVDYYHDQVDDRDQLVAVLKTLVSDHAQLPEGAECKYSINLRPNAMFKNDEAVKLAQFLGACKGLPATEASKQVAQISNELLQAAAEETLVDQSIGLKLNFTRKNKIRGEKSKAPGTPGYSMYLDWSAA